jgi:hypothetical protein
MSSSFLKPPKSKAPQFYSRNELPRGKPRGIPERNPQVLTPQAPHST